MTERPRADRPDDEDDAEGRRAAVTAADDTGLIRNEELIVEAEIAEGEDGGPSS